MKGKVAVVLVSVVGLLIITVSNAGALDPGTEFRFSNTVSPGALEEPWTWTHNLLNTDFDPDMDGSEPYLIINSGNLALKLTFTPEQAGKSVNYMLHLKTDLDDILIGTYNEKFSDSQQRIMEWTIQITKINALKAIADKSATIKIDPTLGTLDRVNSSTLSGSGVVGPEPISMVLVGVGMAGLPFTGSLRRLIKR